MKINGPTLETIYNDNLRTHQIGETNDGISYEAARDLGFQIPKTYDEAVELATPPADHRTSVAPHAGRTALTSAQQNANARRFTAKHLATTESQLRRYKRP